jgi:uncharacterized protein YuzE
MRATFEPETDMAYIYLTNPGDDHRVAHTTPLVVDLRTDMRRLVNLDFDNDGLLIGIEVEGARSALPPSLLKLTSRAGG